VIERAAGWLLVTVIVLLALVVPMFWLAKLSEAGASATGLIPVPFRLAVVGDPKALCITVRVPEIAATEDGVKTTLIIHVAPAAKVLGDVGQLFVWLKFVLVVIELIVSETFWTFLSVNVFAELLKPKATLPAFQLPGDNVTGATPVPLKLIAWELPVVELSVTMIELMKVPRAVGLKVALNVQNAFGASDPGERGQLSVFEKGALGGVMLVITRGAVPVLVRRTDLAELVVPTARFPKLTLVVLRDATCAFRCGAKAKRNKQKLANANRRVEPLICHLCSPEMSLIDAPGENSSCPTKRKSRSKYLTGTKAFCAGQEKGRFRTRTDRRTHSSNLPYPF
jgi:hypothetical protein